MRILQATIFYTFFHVIMIFVGCEPPELIHEGYDVLSYAAELPQKDVVNRAQVSLRLYPDSISNPHIRLSFINTPLFSSMAEPAVFYSSNQFISGIEIITILPLGDSIPAERDVSEYFLVNDPEKFLHEGIDTYLNSQFVTELNLVSTVDFPGDSVHLEVRIVMTDGAMFSPSTSRKPLR